ncbi:MAG TPA: RHS repeat-associated core domain-containing protein, partial [Pyrinomonadaceae bacterium]
AGLYSAGGGANSADRIRYTAAGAATQTRLGNGLWEHTTFNSLLQPTQIGLGTSPADSSVFRLDYSYGVAAGGTLDPARNNGNPRSQTLTVPGAAAPFVQEYTYDALNRLESAEEKAAGVSNWRQVYSYDVYGNRRLAAGTTYPSQLDAANNPAVSPATNRITSPGYYYDDGGNLLCDPSHPCAQVQSSLTSYYEYDAENRIKKAGGGAGSYSYDGDGRRVKSVWGGATTVFVYDAAGRLAAEYGGAAAQDGGTSYVTRDTLGSTRVVTGPAREVRGRYDFLPFGGEIAAGAGDRATAQAYSASDGVRQKFTGYERDAETSLDFAQARYYANTQGRFTSADSYNIILEAQVTAETSPEKAGAQFFGYIDQPQNWNRYVYAANNPLKYVDPTGEVIWLTGTKEERAAALQRIRNIVGEKAAKNLVTSELCTNNGTVTVVDYNRNDIGGLGASGGKIGVRMEELMDSKNIVEFKIAKEFTTENGHFTTARFGGAATVGREESLTGNTQIFVHPDAGNVTQMKLGSTAFGSMYSDNGRALDFYNDIDDFHEFGHAYANAIEGMPLEHGNPASNGRALEFENLIRARRGLSNRRLVH